MKYVWYLDSFNFHISNFSFCAATVRSEAHGIINVPERFRCRRGGLRRVQIRHKNTKMPMRKHLIIGNCRKRIDAKFDNANEVEKYNLGKGLSSNCNKIKEKVSRLCIMDNPLTLRQSVGFYPQSDIRSSREIAFNERNYVM